MLIASKPTVKLLQKRNLLLIKNMGSLLRISIGVIIKLLCLIKSLILFSFCCLVPIKFDRLLLLSKATRLLLFLTSDVWCIRSGATKDGFLLNTLKTLFRLSIVLLELQKCMLNGAIKFVSVRSSLRNLSLCEITKSLNFIIPKILDELLTRSVFTEFIKEEKKFFPLRSCPP